MKPGKGRQATRVLITGFEPFGDSSVNPTQLLVEAVSKGELSTPSSLEVKAVVLPVVFGEGSARLLRELREFRPEVVLAFGQAGGRSAIEFERIAVNLIDGEQKDNAGLARRETPIEPGAPNALFSTLPVREWADHLSANGVPAKVSNTAGLFVCNEVFYRLQHATLRSMVRSGFIHVPYLEEQAKAKGAPFIGFESLRKALELILARLA